MALETIIHCEKSIPAVDGLKEQEITVGRQVLLHCEGEVDSWNSQFDFQKAQIKLEAGQAYSVRVLKAKALPVTALKNKQAAGFQLDLAFYAVGNHSYTGFILTDGANEIHLGPQKINVETVIEKSKDDSKAIEPYGPILPLNLSWPTSYFIVVIVIALAFIGVLVQIIHQKRKFLKLVAKLKNYDCTTPADRQFYKSLRLAEEKKYPLTEVEQAFRLYVLRQYQIPMFDLNDRAVILFFKKKNPWLKKERKELKKILEDFLFLKKIPEDQLSIEMKNFIQKLYRYVDQVEMVNVRTVTK